MFGGVDDYRLICSRLIELRKRHELTQEEFAQLSGLSYKHYQQIESGRKKQIWLETVQRLAAPYGLKTWELIGPELPTETKLVQTVPSSRVHNKSKQP